MESINSRRAEQTIEVTNQHPKGSDLEIARVALLTNFIPPYMLPVLKEFSKAVGDLKIFLSTAMEGNRNWRPHWDMLQVELQSTTTIVRRHKRGIFRDSKCYLHFPYDTISRLRVYRPDVIISAQLGPRTIQSTLYRMWHPVAGLVVWADLSEHTERGTSFGKRIIREMLIGASDAVLVNGKSGARYVTQMGASPDRVILMPFVRYMGKVSAVSQSRARMRKKRLLYVGNLVEAKGVHLLFDALERVRHRNGTWWSSLCIIGDGPMRSELEERARNKSIDATFLGSVPFEGMASHYANTDIFVFPTLCDTWGVVVNEALGAGVPVLGSEFSQAVTELISDGYNGWRFRPDQANEFDTQLERALSTSESVLQTMAEAACVSVRELTPEFAAGKMAMAGRIAYRAAQRRRF